MKRANMNFCNVEFEQSYGTSAQLPKSILPEIAFVGRSNVGKSSLLNMLFNRKGLAKVSQTPGKTTTINFFRSESAHFVDLPGYGYAKVSKTERQRWMELIEGYFNQDRNFALVCSLIDIRHEASSLDENMIRFLREAEFPYLIVLTKSDKLSKSKCLQQRFTLTRQLALNTGTQLIITSALQKTGVEELRQTIAEYLL